MRESHFCSTEINAAKKTTKKKKLCSRDHKVGDQIGKRRNYLPATTHVKSPVESDRCGEQKQQTKKGIKCWKLIWRGGKNYLHQGGDHLIDKCLHKQGDRLDVRY